MTRGATRSNSRAPTTAQIGPRIQFRNKPQALNEAPGIYAPYQPRFDWNLWFASLGGWRDNEIVPLTEERLLLGDGDVLALFRDNPFPQFRRAMCARCIWQYWFTTMDEKRSTGDWWRREYRPLRAGADDGRGWPICRSGMARGMPPHD
jgi:lipase maturation factor 1